METNVDHSPLLLFSFSPPMLWCLVLALAAVTMRGIQIKFPFIYPNQCVLELSTAALVAKTNPQNLSDSILIKQVQLTERKNKTKNK